MYSFAEKLKIWYKRTRRHLEKNQWLLSNYRATITGAAGRGGGGYVEGGEGGAGGLLGSGGEDCMFWLFNQVYTKAKTILHETIFKEFYQTFSILKRKLRIKALFYGGLKRPGLWSLGDMSTQSQDLVRTAEAFVMSILWNSPPVPHLITTFLQQALTLWCHMFYWEQVFNIWAILNVQSLNYIICKIFNALAQTVTN